ncbi:molybdopterin-dependent oxidoreductase [Maridesulfovibrio hydrothermalis]|uniref:Molybdopterin oxidoreductase n=1 Tax=Maridesulfovibrio hydrothermalis AM13 = DSM 14728 TaxID=1121451 RepID=L0RA45_9BACT|nr:molybdopterin-dependent oxidoreductase [Maridesulfovibrio hydrothermalis]CCO23060.1 Molybdopterin oxidoreductase [Maridesulfovibrio hydrothermalis AM13 = DSM 14728]
MSISACTLDCPGTCSFIVEKKGEQATIKGNPKHPFSKGLICAKGKALLKRINHPDRITAPLLKRNGKFEPISWDEAFKICAAEIKGLDAEECLHIKGYGFRGVLAKASTVFFRSLGALETYGSLCDEAGCEAIIQNFGSLDQNNISDLDKADIIVNWGKDLSRSSIHITALIKKLRKSGTKVISISPGGDGNEKLSDETILIRPGTDRFLAAAIIRILIEGGNIEAQVVKNSIGYDEFKNLILKYDSIELADRCNVSIENIRKLSSIYKSDKNVSSLIGWGVQRYSFGGENVRYITTLCALSGKLGKEGSGFYYNISSGRNFASWADTPDTPQERKVLLHDLKNELEARDIKVKFMWIDGINVANQVPNCTEAAQAVENCKFVVTVDAFMNDTAARSNLILPCALTMERDEILGSAMHNCIAWSGKVFEPKGSAMSDFDIIRKLGSLVFENNPIPKAETCFKKAIQTPSITNSLEEIKKQGFIETTWPVLAYENYVFGFADGKMRLPKKLNSNPQKEKGFNLLTLVNKNYIHSQIPAQKQDKLPELYISSESPYLAELENHSEAMLCTDIGKLKITIRIDNTIHPDAAIIRRGGWMKFKQNANSIIAPLITDIGVGAAYYSQKAWLEPSSLSISD